MTGQPEEAHDEIFVFIVDASYNNEANYVHTSDYKTEADLVDAASVAFHERLEAEFNVDFERANIGPGTDIPAYLTILANPAAQVGAGLLATFFLGTKIEQNLEAWSRLFERVKMFFSREPSFNKNGAGILAANAVIAELGHMPDMMQLISYRWDHVGEDQALEDFDKSTEIEETPTTLNVGYMRHVFEISADKKLYRVGVVGAKTKVVAI